MQLFDYSKEEVSVKEALKKGRIFLFWIPFIVMLIFFALGLYIGKENTIWGVALFLSGIIVPSIYYYRVSVLWKLWAFEKVRNLQAIEKKAIERDIIRREFSFWNRLEIITKTEKEKLVALYEKTYVDDSFEDDASIPSIYEIKFNGQEYKSNAKLFGILSTFCFILVYFFNDDPNDMDSKKLYLFLPIIFAMAIYNFYKYQKTSQTKKFIQFNSNGLLSHDHALIPWNDINELELVNKNKELYYAYFQETGEEYPIVQLELENYDVDAIELEKAINAFKFRYMQDQ